MAYNELPRRSGEFNYLQGGPYGGKYKQGGGLPSAGWTDTLYDQGNGSIGKIDGFGSDVIGGLGAVGNLFMMNKSINAQQEDADRRFNFMENESKKNWAMKMNEWRQFQNDRSHSSAKAAAFRDEGGRHLTSAEGDQFQGGSQVVDRLGNNVADPFSESTFSNQTNPMQATNPITGGTSIRNQLSNINNIAGSAFAPEAPVNPVNKLTSRTTTTPQQVAGLAKDVKQGPHAKRTGEEKKRVEKITA